MNCYKQDLQVVDGNDVLDSRGDEPFQLSKVRCGVPGLGGLVDPLFRVKSLHIP